jgi:hypothetical protein
LNAYYGAMLRDARMGASETSRSVAWHVARPRRPWWLWLASGPLRFVFSEIIPEPVRGRLGFRSTAWSRLSLAVATRGMRIVVPWLPGWTRYAPEYRRAMRVVRARQESSDQRRTSPTAG